MYFPTESAFFVSTWVNIKCNLAVNRFMACIKMAEMSF